MLDWIAGYVARWAGVVTDAAIDLVHWGLHALASVVYTVFGAVGKAWLGVHDAWNWVDKGISRFVMWVHIRLNWIITHDIPELWARIVADAKAVVAAIAKAYDAAVAEGRKLFDDAVQRIADLASWVNTHVLEPLTDLIQQLRSDLLKWGYFAYQLLTDLPKLAGLLIRPIVAAAEAAFDDIAAPAGEFAIRLILRQLPKMLKLAETILTAVL